MSKSENLYHAARELIPGGVNSPVRAFTGVGGTPLFIERADGAYLYDVDGKAYIDYVGSWGPMVLGHNHPAIRNAVIEAASRGLSFGAPTEMEVKMAELVTELVPTMDMVRMVNSGTEATMSAIRLARGFTGRDKIIKFEGCYHGHADCLLVKAGSGALTLGQPNSPGVPADFAKHTLTCTYNDLASVRAAFEQYPQDIACIIVEPVAGNMNCIPPQPEFPAGPARVVRRIWRPADHRRSDDRLPRGAGGRPGLLRRGAGSDLSRENHRRRDAGGRLRRPPRSDGRAGADRPGVPGWYALR